MSNSQQPPASENNGDDNADEPDRPIQLPNRILVDNKGSPYISVNEYMRIKLERNKVYLKFLTLHNELLRKEIILNYRTYDMNKQKIQAFDEINRIEALQANYFVSAQEDKVTKMYAELNRMAPLDYEQLQSDIEKLRKECLKLRILIDNFNDKIPRTINIIGVN